MNRVLVIGDLHLNDFYPGYLKEQSKTLLKIVEKENPNHIIFLGDIFHFRAPKPSVLLELDSLLRLLSEKVKKIILLRGNHDSSSKSDDTRTALEVYKSDKVDVIVKPECYKELNFYFIPHYENNDLIIKYLKDVEICEENKPYLRKSDPIIFGHFGYNGCLNSIGAEDFTVDKKYFTHETILGHIHKYKKEGNITVLGTPWSTCFSECDYPHYYMMLEGDGLKKYKSRLEEINFGLRYYNIPYEGLEANKEDISNSNYSTILRVMVSKFDPNGILSNPSELRKKIFEQYSPMYVDLKFSPILDGEYNRYSNFSPDNLSTIDEKVIEMYLGENKTSIPNEDLLRILNEIRETCNK